MKLPFFLFIITLLFLSTFTRADDDVDFCEEDSKDGYWNILDASFTNSLDRNVFSTFQTKDEYTYDNLCGGDYAACRPSNVIVDSETLQFRTRAEQVIDEYKYTTGGVHTRDSFVIKRTEESITRLCFKIKVNQYVDGITPVIRLAANNAFHLNQTIYDTFSDFEDDMNQQDQIMIQNQQQQQLTKKKRPIYNPHYPRYGNETLACNPDFGELTAFALTSNDKFTTTFSWQEELDKGNCQYPKNNLYTSIENDIGDKSEYYNLGIEYGPRYIAIYKGNELIKNITQTEDEKVLGIHSTEPYYLSFETRINKDTIPYLNEGNEYIYEVKKIKITHFDPIHHTKSLFDFKLGIIALSALAGVAVIAFIGIFLCGVALNKKARNQQLDYEEDLLLNN